MKVHEECPKCVKLTECELLGDRIQSGYFIQSFKCTVCGTRFTKSVSILTSGERKKGKKRRWWN